MNAIYTRATSKVNGPARMPINQWLAMEFIAGRMSEDAAHVDGALLVIRRALGSKG